jgi:hypothetical protein
LAKTSRGVEFYLLEVFGDKRSTSIQDVAKTLRAAIRDTDAAFIENSRLYIAFAGDVRGAAKATRRLMNVTKKEGIKTRYRLVVEPFPEDIWTSANRVIDGEIELSMRPVPVKIEEETDSLEE